MKQMLINEWRAAILFRSDAQLMC